MGRLLAVVLIPFATRLLTGGGGTTSAVHAVDAATGDPAWPTPAVVADDNNIITRPVVVGGTAYGWSEWEGQDWAFWIYQSIPQAFNFAYQFRDDGTNELQATRDVLFGVVFLVWSSVYAHYWPSSYRDAPKAPGLVLSANVFGNTCGICELILLLFGYDQMPVQAVVKIMLGTVGNILGFTANVLSLVDS